MPQYTAPPELRQPAAIDKRELPWPPYVSIPSITDPRLAEVPDVSQFLQLADKETVVRSYLTRVRRPKLPWTLLLVSFLPLPFFVIAAIQMHKRAVWELEYENQYREQSYEKSNESYKSDIEYPPIHTESPPIYTEPEYKSSDTDYNSAPPSTTEPYQIDPNAADPNDPVPRFDDGFKDESTPPETSNEFAPEGGATFHELDEKYFPGIQIPESNLNPEPEPVPDPDPFESRDFDLNNGSSGDDSSGDPNEGAQLDKRGETYPVVFLQDDPRFEKYTGDLETKGSEELETKGSEEFPQNRDDSSDYKGGDEKGTYSAADDLGAKGGSDSYLTEPSSATPPERKPSFPYGRIFLVLLASLFLPAMVVAFFFVFRTRGHTFLYVTNLRLIIVELEEGLIRRDQTILNYSLANVSGFALLTQRGLRKLLNILLLREKRTFYISIVTKTRAGFALGALATWGSKYDPGRDAVALCAELDSVVLALKSGASPG